jgi:hypothetical protein
MDTFKKYTRTGVIELRPYLSGEDTELISIASTDYPEEDMGMVARNPDNHDDQWYVNKSYFEKNYVEAPDAKE